MTWQSCIKGFQAYLILERSLSANTIAAYINDVEKLHTYCTLQAISKQPTQVTLDDLQACVKYFHDLGLHARSQARIISGIKHFFQYCIIEQIVKENPSELLEAPKLPKYLPDVLAFAEIEHMIQCIDLSHVNGTRNKAMLEVLYSCGLRVSELIDLKLSHIYSAEQIIKVIGKGNKERLIPIGDSALKQVRLYVETDRKKATFVEKYSDMVFVSAAGKPISRVMVFYMIKAVAKQSGIQKEISPHTFRQSFATHLIENGADLRAIQEMLGHESIVTTEIYTHLNKSFLRDTLQKHHPRYR